MAKATYPGPADRLVAYEAAVAEASDDDGVPLSRKGAKNPYTSRNGHMYSFLTPEGQLAVRLPKDRLEQFLAEHGTERPVSYGAVMKEYALVPDGLLEDAAAAGALIQESHDWIGTLPPKPTKKG